MARPRLHLDADISNRALQRALLERGHDVTRTPNPWMRVTAADLEQLLGATAQGRCVFTFNVRDFVSLGTLYPEHHGIIVAARSAWTLSALIVALDRLLRETDADDWLGQIRWLNQWR